MSSSTPRRRSLYPWRCILAAVFCILVLCSPVALAHGDLHGQIETVSRQLEKSPTAELYLRRGELHRAHQDHAAALADYDRAERLDAKLDAVHLARGRALLETGRHGDSEKALTLFLKRQPKHADGYLYRARAEVGLKQYEKAGKDYDRAIELSTTPKPDYYLERADAHKAAGNLKEALEGLEQGISKLGPLVTLSLAAIDIEVALRRYDDAVSRLDRLMAGAQRKERWLERKAAVLNQAGRKGEARQTYEDALKAVASLPQRLRNIRATQETEKRIRQALAALAPSTP